MNYLISFSIVIYKQPREELLKVLRSLLLYKGEKRIFLIDNSPTDGHASLRALDACIDYRWEGCNVGFGCGHNIAFRMAQEAGSRYHVVVNPDIFYEEDPIATMADYMDRHTEVGLMMPKVLYPNGKIQYLPKLFPSPWQLLWRTLKVPFRLHLHVSTRFEMREMREPEVYCVPSVSGCFSMFRLSALKEVGGYDERYFMYFEDTDLSRRMHKQYDTCYFSRVKVFHNYGHGARHNLRLFLIFMTSAVRYFNKWGWLFDSERRHYNRRALQLMHTKHHSEVHKG